MSELMSDVTVQLICGGRGFSDRKWMIEHVRTAIECNESAGRVIHFVAGAAPGADTLAAEVVESFGYPLREYPADWATFGRGAGMRRNRQMLNYLLHCRTEGADVEVVAFPGGVGTDQMRCIAQDAGVPVYSPSLPMAV